MFLTVSGMFCGHYRLNYYRDASKYLVEVLQSVSPNDLEDVMEKILDAVEKQPRKSTLDVS